MPLTFNASSVGLGSALSSDPMRVIRKSVADPPIFFRGAVTLLPAPPAEISRPIPRSRKSRLRLFARLFGIFRHHRPPASEQSAAVHL